MFGRHVNHFQARAEERCARHEHGWHRGHFGHPQHGGRGRMGRFFDHGDLRLVILQLIAEKPRHGYEIIKAIEEKVGGAYSPSPGVIYPTLTMLEELGYVTVTAGDGGKKLQSITEEGRAFLAANKAAVDGLLARMSEAGERHGGGPAPQILRAFENLKMALRLRLAQGPLDEAQIAAIAGAVDAAAVAVERS
jgi:DNA-binding PadR family transcriptional regulator